MGQQQKHNILRYLTSSKAPAASSQAASSEEQEPSNRPFKQPRLHTGQQQQHKAHQLALR